MQKNNYKNITFQKIIKEIMPLSFILLLAFVIRIWGVGFCLPFRYCHIDESVVIFYTMRFFGGDFNPYPFFDYPALHLYVLFIIYFFYMIFSGHSPGTFMDLFMNDPSAVYLIGRAISVIMGVATVYVTYRIAKRLYDEKTGLLASLFMCLNMEHVLHSHYATVDVPALFFVMIASMYAIKVFFEGGLKNYILAGLFTGFAAATKYYGAVLFVNVMVFYLTGMRSNDARKKVKWYFLLSCAVFLLAGFTIGAPYSMLDFSRFMARFFDRFRLIVNNAPAGAVSIFNKGWFSYPGIMVESTGWFFTLFSVGSIIYFGIKKEKKYLIPLSFVIVLYLLIGSWQVSSSRYALPLYPFFAIINAGFIYSLRQNLKNGRLKKYLVHIFVLILVFTALPQIIKRDMILGSEDTRQTAYKWFIENVPQGSRVLRLPFTPEFRSGENYRVKVDWDQVIKDRSIKELKQDYDYVITSSSGNDAESGFEKRLNAEAKILNEFKGKRAGMFHNPRIRIYSLEK